MEAFGFSPAQINKALTKDQDFEVLRENWVAVRWFTEVDDLFIVNSGVLIGLDLQAIKADAEFLGREYTPDDYRRLRVIGRAATAAINERSAQR